MSKPLIPVLLPVKTHQDSYNNIVISLWDDKSDDWVTIGNAGSQLSADSYIANLSKVFMNLIKVARNE